MTLTVRLPESLESALQRYCDDRGVSKSSVVQESLATYLFASPSRPAKGRAKVTEGQIPVSSNYRAFADAGLIGGVALGQGADKMAVRARVAQRIAQRKAAHSTR
jgi:hypothetical protein